MFMKTPTEIHNRIESRKGNDILGFEIYEYFNALNFEQMKPYLEEDINSWDQIFKTDNDILAYAEDYMPFAFSKAHAERGISANRSIMHYIAWIWLLGDDEFTQKIENMYETNYHDYGISILNTICDHFGWKKE
jgi:hypothetical protein